MIRNGDHVRILVRDNGIGIAPQHQERIFQVFERLHGQEEYPGTGIGLAIVKRGIQRMNGNLGLDSTPGKAARSGSSFRRHRIEMSQTVLLVEDDTADSKLIRRAFDKAQVSARLVRAKDGDDAVAYLDGTGPYIDREEHPSPTLVLLDIKLPRRSGFEVLSWIRRDTRPLRRTPVVMLTSSRHAVDINRAYELGANAYTVKPDTHAEMIRLLGSIHAFWIDHSEPPLVASPEVAVAGKTCRAASIGASTMSPVD